MDRDNMIKYWDYKTVEEVLRTMDFTLLVSKNEDGELVLKLKDDLNMIDFSEEEFTDFDSLMRRLAGTYCQEYYEQYLLEEFKNEIGEWETYKDLYNQLMDLPIERTKWWLWDINILGLFGEVYD